MNVSAKFDEIPSMTLQDIKETKCYGHTFVHSLIRTDGQRENSIPSHKHSLREYKKPVFSQRSSFDWKTSGINEGYFM